MPHVWVDDIEQATKRNTNFRAVLWTGSYCQLTVMSIAPGEDIGLEVHSDVDQFLRVEQGEGRLDSGPSEDDVSPTQDVSDDWAMIIPAGTWHNIINTGNTELKIYSIYAPPNHPEGAVHVNKAEAEAAEHA